MSYTDTLAVMADRCGADMVALHATYEAGRLTLAEFIEAALALLDTHRSTATALADLALAAELTRLRGAVVAPLGLPHRPEVPQSVVTDAMAAAAYLTGAAAAMAVLGRSQALSAAQDAYQEGMTEHGVLLWRRVPNAGACEVCIDLASQGAVPTAVPMWHHKGCGCTQQPLDDPDE